MDSDGISDLEVLEVGAETVGFSVDAHVKEFQMLLAEFKPLLNNLVKKLDADLVKKLFETLEDIAQEHEPDMGFPGTSDTNQQSSD